MKGIVILAVLVALPAHILFENYTVKHGFLGLINFGEEFQESALPEVKEISPVTSSQRGYDGQFYAQLALHPGLTEPGLVNALDSPEYRSRRIGMPFLAFCLGLGKTAWVLEIYALLNFFFWLALLLVILKIVGYTRPRDLLLAFALLWSTGTLISVAKSLTDFPATALGALAVFSNGNYVMAALLLGTSGLVKETSVLSFAAVPWGRRRERLDVKHLFISTLILLLPITLWFIYVHVRIPSGLPLRGNFTIPFFGIAHKLWSSLYGLATGTDTTISKQLMILSESLAPLSLLVQATYLTFKPRFSSEAWRFGIGFVILFSLIGESIWVEQFAYCRVLLPLTFSFNMLIHEHEFNQGYLTWYLLGNGGMYSLALHTVLKMVIPI